MPLTRKIEYLRGELEEEGWPWALPILDAVVAERSRLLTALDEKDELYKRWMLAALKTEPPTLRPRTFDPLNPGAYAAWRAQVELDLIERAQKAESALVLQKEELEQWKQKYRDLDDYIKGCLV